MPGKMKGKRPPGPVKTGLGLAAALLLTGCLDGQTFGAASRSDFGGAETGVTTGALSAQPGDAGAVIADLKARASILPAGGNFDRIAAAVVANSTGAAAAELRLARLKAEAKEKNWLPQIGPDLSLSSLSGLAASLLMEAALFDNGRKKAEREYAAADVEVAAVSLVAEMNDQVYAALESYVTATRADRQATIDAAALGRLSRYQDIMRLRVEGGLSDASEQQIIDQTLVEMQATLAADRNAADVAAAELASLTGGGVSGLGGMDALPADAPVPEPLGVLRARAKAGQSIAGAKITRAGLLPGITAQASVDETGQVESGLGLGLDSLVGVGTGSAIAATEAVSDVAQRQIAAAAEESQRKIAALLADISTLEMRRDQGAAVLSQTAANLDMYVRQYEVGRRSLIELVGEFDRHARLERDQAAVDYEIVLKRLAIARQRGVLVSGVAL